MSDSSLTGVTIERIKYELDITMRNRINRLRAIMMIEIIIIRLLTSAIDTRYRIAPIAVPLLLVITLVRLITLSPEPIVPRQKALPSLELFAASKSGRFSLSSYENPVDVSIILPEELIAITSIFSL